MAPCLVSDKGLLDLKDFLIYIANYKHKKCYILYYNYSNIVLKLIVMMQFSYVPMS